MPLHILILLVVVGIGGIALILHLTGRSRTALLTWEDIEEAWLRHFPDDVISDVRLADDGLAALVATQAGSGVIWVFGADTVARHLSDCRVSETKNGVKIDFHDYAAPPRTFVLASTERESWLAELETA